MSLNNSVYDVLSSCALDSYSMTWFQLPVDSGMQSLS